MRQARWSAGVLAVLVLAGCGGQEPPQAGPVASASTPTPSPTATPTPTLTPTPTPTRAPTKPPVPAADCTGSFKNGRFTLSGRSIFITGQTFSCAGGQMIAYDRLRSAVRFHFGAKSVTLGARESAKLGGYRIRVGLANSKQATFTVDVL